MKVLHVVYCLDVGGLETFVIDLAQQHKTEADSVIVCLTQPGALSCRFHGELHYLKKLEGWRWKTFADLAKVVRKVRPDVIHTHNQGANLYGSVTGKILGVPVIYTKHGRSEGPQHSKVLKMDRFSALFTEKVVCVSEDVGKLCIDAANVAPSKVVVVPNGINTELYQPTSRIRRAADEDVVVGCVARLAVEKDHLTLLKSCLLLAERGAKFKLVLVGDGACRKAIEDFVAGSELGGRVELFGTRHDIPSLLATFDIFAMSSITEGMSLTLLEAMSAGLPVVTTRVGGNPEVVVDGETGFLVDAQSPEQLADKLGLLVENAVLRQEMGAQGRARVLDNFSLSACAGHYMRLYKAVAAA